jgi:hypothetical protein
VTDFFHLRQATSGGNIVAPVDGYALLWSAAQQAWFAGAVVGGVSSVFGRTGAVVAATGDYDSDQIINLSGVLGATVSDALDTLASGAGVSSVFGRTGAVVAATADYNSDQVTNLSGVAGATVSDALDTLASGAGVSSVFGRTGAVVAATGDYNSDQLTNLSAVPGAVVSDALDALAAVSGVSSVFGRTGAVVAAAGDYTSTQVTNSSAVAGATTSDALNTLNAVIDLTGARVTAGPANTFLAGGASANQWLPVFTAPTNPGQNGFIPRASSGDFTYVGGASTGQMLNWNGSQWQAGVDFGALTPVTTDGFAANNANGYVRLGLVAGSGSGAASAASAGNIRGARGTNGFVINIRNNADSADLTAFSADTVSGPTLTMGSTASGGFSTLMAAPTAGTVTLRVGSSASQVQLANGTFAIGVATMNFSGAANSTFTMSVTSNATAFNLSITGQTSSAVGGTGGPVIITGGTTSGGSGTRTGGFVGLVSGAGQSAAGDLRLVFGTGGGANLSIGGTAANTAWQSMAGGAFVADRTAAPTGNPTAGYYWWSETGGLPSWRTVAGDRITWNLVGQTTVGAAGGASALPLTPTVYIQVTHNGTLLVVPAYAQA